MSVLLVSLVRSWVDHAEIWAVALALITVPLGGFTLWLFVRNHLTERSPD